MKKDSYNISTVTVYFFITEDKRSHMVLTDLRRVCCKLIWLFSWKERIDRQLSIVLNDLEKSGEKN